MEVNFVQALRNIEKEKDIPREILEDIIEQALISAYKRHFGTVGEIHVEIQWEGGKAAVFARKVVVENVENPHLEMSLEEARQLDPTVKVGESLDIEVTPEDFGRIAAQTAKQVVIQRIREVEREIIYEEFSEREGEVVTGVVQRRDGRSVFINLGKIEAILPPYEQMPLDDYRFGERLKVYIVEVKRTTKTPNVLVSRTHPGLLRRLFELEVPEVHEGVVEIKSVAREAGARSKAAVASRQDNVDPVGACVGHRGNRVQAMVDELRGEKIDIVRWSEDMNRYLASALSPAKVSRVLLEEEQQAATVIVPDTQLSLAIGKEGQNVRLAARLTGWRIDIRSETQIAQGEAAPAEAAAAEAAAEPSEEPVAEEETAEQEAQPEESAAQTAEATEAPEMPEQPVPPAEQEEAEPESVSEEEPKAEPEDVPEQEPAEKDSSA